jgi:hypothetical protein
MGQGHLLSTKGRMTVLSIAIVYRSTMDMMVGL